MVDFTESDDDYDRDSLVEEDDDYDRESLGGMEQDDEDLEFTSPSVSNSKVITKESLLAAQKEDLHRVMDLLTLSEQNARTLLIYHRWDVERLLADLVEKGRDQLFTEAGVTVSEPKDHSSTKSLLLITCNICIEDVSCNDVSTMDCGHCFCNDCWTEYFIVKINEGQSKRIRCMAHKCNSICDEAIVRNLVSAKHPDLAERFERFLLESYIVDNNRVKWCPSIPHCGNAIRVDGDVYCEVECTCGVQFCFSCSSEAHSPCSCLMWELWSKKCRDESETMNWLTVHTKLCPKCRKPVEKNGGCNLVSCICGQAFCWLCGGATGHEHTWSSIRGHSCGRYTEDKEKQAEHAKRELKRYMHYFGRFKAHMDSLKLETKLKETVQQKIEVSEEKESIVKDYSWVTNGLYRLFRSRRVLAYSYPFAYYMFGEDLFGDEITEEERKIKKNLFEDQQQQLEINVENLSKAIEEPFEEFSDDEVLNIRMKVLNLSCLTDNLCKKMYECIENDLLGSLQLTTHNIAPYYSKGVERAAELTVCWDFDQNPEPVKANKDNHQLEAWSRSVTGTGVNGSSGRNSGGTSSPDESGCSNRKRARKEDLGGIVFDLNLPAEVIDKS